MKLTAIRYRLSPNGNPWWTNYHDSCVFYEIQINKDTNNVLFGMGPLAVRNRKVAVEDVIKDAAIHKEIVRDFDQETLDTILEICKGKGEVVHHIDCDKLNNSPENLDILDSESDHRKSHNSLEKIAIELLPSGQIDYKNGTYTLKEK